MTQAQSEPEDGSSENGKGLAPTLVIQHGGETMRVEERGGNFGIVYAQYGLAELSTYRGRAQEVRLVRPDGAMVVDTLIYLVSGTRAVRTGTAVYRRTRG